MMQMKQGIQTGAKTVLLSLLLGAATQGAVAQGAVAQTLHVYGPGGPVAPMQGCGKLFRAQTQIEVTVTAGPEKQWISAAAKDADIVYGGAEYMLTQFDLDHPDFLDRSTRIELYPRGIGILVRKGNPKRIQSFADLTKSGVRILDVNGAGQLGAWEDLAGRQGLLSAFQNHIAVSVPNSAEAIRLWNAQPDLDAWISYESWQRRYPESFAFVALAPQERLYRGTPVAVAARSLLKPQALQFLSFLRSPACHAAFQKAGWE